MTPEEQKELQIKSKPHYKTFLKGDGGHDLMVWLEREKNNLLLKGQGAATTDEKASCLSEINGIMRMKDYMIRQAQEAPSKGGATSTRRSASKGRKG